MVSRRRFPVHEFADKSVYCIWSAVDSDQTVSIGTFVEWPNKAIVSFVGDGYFVDPSEKRSALSPNPISNLGMPRRIAAPLFIMRVAKAARFVGLTAVFD